MNKLESGSLNQRLSAVSHVEGAAIDLESQAYVLQDICINFGERTDKDFANAICKQITTFRELMEKRCAHIEALIHAKDGE